MLALPGACLGNTEIGDIPEGSTDSDDGTSSATTQGNTSTSPSSDASSDDDSSSSDDDTPSTDSDPTGPVECPPVADPTRCDGTCTPWGEQQWSTMVPGRSMELAIAVDPGERIALVTSAGGTTALSVVDAGGTVWWTAPLAGFSPKVAFDVTGDIVVTTAYDDAARIARYDIDGNELWSLDTPQAGNAPIVPTEDGGVWIATPGTELVHVSSAGEVDGGIALETPTNESSSVHALAAIPDSTDLLVAGRDLVGGNGGEERPWLQRVGTDGTRRWQHERAAYGVVAGDCDTLYAITDGEMSRLVHLDADDQELWSQPIPDTLPWLVRLQRERDELLVLYSADGAATLERFGTDGSQQHAPLAFEPSEIIVGDFTVAPGGDVWVGHVPALDAEELVTPLTRHTR